MSKKEQIELKMSFHEHYQMMWPFIKPYLFRAILAILVSVPIGALDSVIALSLKPYMDIVVVEKSVRAPIYIPFLIIAFTSLQGGLNYIAAYLNSWVGMKINMDLKRHLFKKLMRMETSYFDINNSGVILQRFSADCDVACTGLLDNLRIFVARFFSSFSLVCVLIYNSWQLAIIAVSVMFLAFLPLSTVKRRIKSTIEKSVQESAKIFVNYNEVYSGNKTIAGYNLQNHMYQKFDGALKVLFKLGIKMVQKTAWVTPLMHIVVSAGIGAVVWYGSSLIVTGRISAGNFVSFITALILLYTPVKGIGKSFNSVQVAFLAIERLVEILNIEPKVKEKENALVLDKVKKDIEFKNVWFEYREGVPVLKDVNLKVKAGANLAIVGNSGGGKTTLVNLLPRFYDVTKGQILIDGHDIRDYTLQSLRENMAVVFQDNFLFSGTIRENILSGRPDATEEDIRRVLKLVYLDDFVDSLADGLDTTIGERGTTLSGGQRQRVAIARALLKDSPIVILDEATSALDNKSEAIVQKAIENLMKNRTVFVIAHRLSTIKNAEKIIVVNDGQIVEEGTHEELLNIENGSYKMLYNAQFKTKE